MADASPAQAPPVAPGTPACPAPPTQVRLAAYPKGMPGEDTWTFTHDAPPEPADGQVRVRMDWISVDPGMRGWITPKRSYMPPVEPGEVMRAFGVGTVVESRFERLAAGDIVTGFTGVQTEAVLPGRELRRIDTQYGAPQSFLSGLGMTGYTAYFGLLDVGRPEAGQTVVVSAAAGAVGSVVCQVAKIRGCRVVAIAGGPEKCRFLREELGVDAAIDHRGGDVGAALAAAAPEGIDVYFDNVGGDILDAVLARINRHARIVVCGGISQYADMDNVRGPSNYLQLIAQSAVMQGFTMRDYLRRIPEALVQLLTWSAGGQLKFREHVLDGIETFPAAFGMLLRGENHGKLLIRVRGGSEGDAA
jgi:NADPH-dependent curcumin reductase CurA